MKSNTLEYRRQYRKKRRKTPEGKLERYRYGAKRRGLCFELTKEQFVSILMETCHYCGGDEGVGVDRKDNHIGYIPTNCIPCCTMCNRMKMAHEYEEFLAKVEEIYKNLIK